MKILFSLIYLLSFYNLFGQNEAQIKILFISPHSIEIDSSINEKVIEYQQFWSEMYPTKEREDKGFLSLTNLDEQSKIFLKEFSLSRMIAVEEANTLGSMLIFDKIEFVITFLDTNYLSASNLYNNLISEYNYDFIVNIDSVYFKEYYDSFFIDADINVYSSQRNKLYKPDKKNYDFPEVEIERSKMDRVGYAFPLKTYRTVIGKYTTPILNLHRVRLRNINKE